MRFSIPEALPGQNVLLRMHWAKRLRLRKRVAWLVKAALIDPSVGWPIGRAPIQRCRITVTRYCRRPLDGDNSASCVKSLFDVLQPFSKTHPDGLGVIANDSSECIIEQRVIQLPGTTSMLVEIEEIA